MEFLSLHSSLLRLPVWSATLLILWIPAGFLWEPHGTQGTLGVLFHASGKQLDISSCKLWFKEFHKVSRALLTWSPLHKLNHTTSQISYLKFAVSYMERTRCNHQDMGVSFPETTVFTFFLHTFLLSGWAAFGSPWVEWGLDTIIKCSLLNCPR